MSRKKPVKKWLVTLIMIDAPRGDEEYLTKNELKSGLTIFGTTGVSFKFKAMQEIKNVE